MLAQKMFAEEQAIRQKLKALRVAIDQERQRYHLYSPQTAGALKAKEAWKTRIIAYAETSNILADYLTDYTLGAHGVLKHLKAADEQIRQANTCLIYANQLHTKRAERIALEMAEKMFFDLGGQLLDKLEPVLRASWSNAVNNELQLYEMMVQERRNSHAN
jgi:hypothetical protein